MSSTTGPDPTSGTGTQAIDRAASLIAAVVHADRPLTFQDLVEECGLPKSTTSRVLSSLERTELVERNDDGYVAGPLFWLYATRHDPWDELVRVAYPILELVGEDTHETVNLSVSRGDRVVQVAQVEATYLLATRDWTDVDVPSHCSALGKTLMAYGALTVGSGRLERVTDRTITHRETLQRDLAEVLRRGWAVTRDELEIGLGAIAVPVRGRGGDVVAALGVWGPTSRLEVRFAELGRSLQARAEELTRLLRGHDPIEGVAV